MVGAVDGVRVSFLVQLNVCAAMDLFDVVLSLSILGVGLVKDFSPSEMVLSSVAPSERRACLIVSVGVVLEVALEPSEMCVHS